MLHSHLKFIAALAIAFSGTVPLLAQDSAGNATREQLPQIAHLEPPLEDLDYSLMGEFVGVVAIGEDRFDPLGLQLSPTGPGEFQALQFIGGLPGHEGFHSSKTIPLIGRRFEKALVMSGGPWAIWVHQDHCLIFDVHGKSLGRLERIQRGSITMGARPPKDAVILFDGSGTEQFTTASMTEDRLLMAGADVRPMFQDFHLHCEFRLPFMPNSDDQARGNSGCYLQSRYEVQILDSFAQLPKFNGAAALYRTKSPDINMSFPPLVWQTYDISFTAPRWAADGTKIRHARITVWHNGVKVQDNVEIPSKTGAGKEEEPTLLPIRFQNHKDPVVFRNIWIIDRGLTDGIAFPVMSPTPEQLEAERQAAEAKAAQEKTAQEADDQKAAAQQIPDASDGSTDDTVPSVESAAAIPPSADDADPTADSAKEKSDEADSAVDGKVPEGTIEQPAASAVP